MSRRFLQPVHRIPFVLLAAAIAGCAWILVAGAKPWEMEPDAVGWQDDVVRGLYWGSAAALVLGLLLLATLPWWNRELRVASAPPQRLSTSPGSGVVGERGMATGWFWLAVGAAVVLAGLLRLPLAGRSLWWDEAWQVRQASHGLVKEDPKQPGTLKFFPTSWDRCAWYYQKPTNHVPVALGSKAALTLRHRLLGTPDEEFSELAVRAPTLLAALGSVVAIAVLVRAWGFPFGGVIAAFLLAIHPWHIRYGVDARSYSLLVLWTILGCLWLTRMFGIGAADARAGSGLPVGMSDPRRWWWLFGLNQFLLLWSYVSAVYLAAAFFLLAAVLCLRSGWSGRDRTTALARLTAVNVAAAMLFLVVAGPLVFQAGRWLDEIGIDHPVTPDLLANTAIQALFGVERSWPDVAHTEGLANFVTLTRGSGVVALLVLLTASASGLFGALALRRRNPRAFAVVVSVVAGTLLYIASTWIRGDIFFERFAIYLIVPVVVLLAIGAAALGGENDPTRPTHPGRVLGTGLGLVALYGLFVGPQIEVLASRPYAPLREVAETLGTPGPDRPVVLLGYGLGGRIVEVYNPHVEYILQEPGRAQLAERMREASAAGHSLLVYYGYDSFNRTLFPSAFELLDDPSYFQEIAAYSGIEPDFHFRIFQFTGKPVAEPAPVPNPVETPGTVPAPSPD